MKPQMKNILTTIRPGPEQRHRNLTVVPLLDRTSPILVYRTLSQALESGAFRVEEVSVGGSVPQLKVINKSEVVVLLLDGEELAGARQNRVLNATILVAARSELIIPVSCTEHGRWRYTSPTFFDSGVVMPLSQRAAKSRDVHQSLHREGTYSPNQSAVWDRVSRLHTSLGSFSATGAMREAFTSRLEQLDEYLDAFELVPEQRGLAIASGTKWVGVELISRPEAYAALHAKLVRSYAMDALLESGTKEPSPGPEEALSSFISRLVTCEETQYPSVGLGVDHRYAGSGLVGSALIVEDEPIHAAFFSTDGSSEDHPDTTLAGFNRRRSFLTG